MEELYFPEPQLEQAVEPVSVLYFPEEQGSQADSLVASVAKPNLPGEQGVQEVAAGPEYLPGPQLEQAESPLDPVAYFPAAQFEQLDAPTELNLPIGQSVQLVDAVEELNFPIPQGSHDELVRPPLGLWYPGSQ